MKLGVYSICDTKNFFSELFTAINDPAAVRQFGQYAKHVDLVKDNPADFSLFKVADFDNVSGIIDPVLVPENLGSAMMFKDKE